MKLIIFDLDETIVEFHKIHNKVTELVFKKIYNVKAHLNELDFTGKTIQKNLYDLAILKKISKNEIKRKNSATIKTYENLFLSLMPKNVKPHILPGTEILIKELKKDKNNILAVLTGSSEKITKKILHSASLLKYFSFIVTGEYEKNRKKLAKYLLEKVKNKYKIEKTFMIGDSIRDIEAGKAVNAFTIAVLTGFHSKEQLKKSGVDCIFKNLNDKKIINIINKHQIKS